MGFVVWLTLLSALAQESAKSPNGFTREDVKIWVDHPGLPSQLGLGKWLSSDGVLSADSRLIPALSKVHAKVRIETGLGRFFTRVRVLMPQCESMGSVCLLKVEKSHRERQGSPDGADDPVHGTWVPLEQFQEEMSERNTLWLETQVESALKGSSRSVKIHFSEVGRTYAFDFPERFFQEFCVWRESATESALDCIDGRKQGFLRVHLSKIRGDVLPDPIGAGDRQTFREPAQREGMAGSEGVCEVGPERKVCRTRIHAIWEQGDSFASASYRYSDSRFALTFSAWGSTRRVQAVYEKVMNRAAQIMVSRRAISPNRPSPQTLPKSHSPVVRPGGSVLFFSNSP